MRVRPSFCVLAVLALAGACKGSGSSSADAAAAADASADGGTSDTGTPPVDPCPPCVTARDCAPGSTCAQLAGDTYCASFCGSHDGILSVCASTHACTPLMSAEGEEVEVCVPRTDVCGSVIEEPPPRADGSVPDAGPPAVCGRLVGAETVSCCHACETRPDCQANGCYGGWFCNTETCRCQSPPDPATCSAPPDAGPRPDAGGEVPDGAIGPSGGTLDVLHFAIVGDTRPPSEDDTAGYPTSIITQIYQDIDAESPRPPFTVATGDYMFASPRSNESNAQLDLYLAARAFYSNLVFFTLGNHECTGATASNCGAGERDGTTRNYEAFMTRMLGPLGKTTPYYTVRIDAGDASWTSKFVFVAGNGWTSDQATWLETELAQPTTYTFVVRHEPTWATRAPGVIPSDDIIAQHPLTLLIVGHTHSFSYSSRLHQIVVGIGGAPLSSSDNYGYVIARQRPDMAIEFSAIDYASLAVSASFAVLPDGTFTQ